MDRPNVSRQVLQVEQADQDINLQGHPRQLYKPLG